MQITQNPSKSYKHILHLHAFVTCIISWRKLKKPETSVARIYKVDIIEWTCNMHLRLRISGKATSPVPFLYLPFSCIFSNRLGLLGSSQRASCVSSSASCANPSSKRCLARKAHQTARFSSLSISAWAAADLGWEKPGLGFWRFPKVNFPNISQLSCSVWPKSSKGLQHRFTLTACNILDKQSGKSKASRMILPKQFPGLWTFFKWPWQGQWRVCYDIARCYHPQHGTEQPWPCLDERGHKSARIRHVRHHARKTLRALKQPKTMQLGL